MPSSRRPDRDGASRELPSSIVPRWLALLVLLLLLSAAGFSVCSLLAAERPQQPVTLERSADPQALDIDAQSGRDARRAREDDVAGRFRDKVVLVTGAASGIGLASVQRFAAEGAALVLGDVDEEGLAAARKGVETDGGRAIALATDVSDRAQVEALTRAAASHFGGLDVVFNNAGIGAFGKTPDLDPEVWLRTFEVDVHSVFYGCRAAIPLLRERGGGAIVNTASISGLAGDYGLSAYNAAKGAVVNYTRAAAIEHARENIRINAVCPGPVETPLAHSLIHHERVADAYRRAIPMGRVGRAEEIAAVTAFLASEDASYVTGAMIVVDGGLLAATGQPNFHQLLTGGPEEGAGSG